MSTSTVPSVLDWLCDSCLASSSFLEVIVASGPVPADAGTEFVVFAGTERASEDWATLGNRSKEETYNVEGAVRVSVSGAGEEVIREARDRAYELLTALDALLMTDPTCGGACRVARMSGHDLMQTAEPGIRLAQIEFTIAVAARI